MNELYKILKDTINPNEANAIIHKGTVCSRNHWESILPVELDNPMWADWFVLIGELIDPKGITNRKNYDN